MMALFADGRIVDAILALTVVEAAGLAWLYHARGVGIAPADLLPNLAAGVCLLLALRAALSGGPWWWIAASLAAGGAAHLIDLRRRWGRSAKRDSDPKIR